MRQGRLYTFQNFILDVDNACLRQGQEQRMLRPKAFDMLRYFVERPGQLVTRDELFQALWPNIVVDGATLTGCIRAIRTALNDDAKQPRLIETVPTRGYRFIGKVVSSQHSVVRREEEKQNAKGKTQKAKIGTVFPAPNTQHPTPVLVGRDAELAVLHQWLDKALRGERQVVFVSGEPGIGKTTLVNAFLQGLDSSVQRRTSKEQRPFFKPIPDLQPLTPSLWIGRGQCIEHYGEGEAYLPVLEAFGRLVGKPENALLLDLLRRYAPSWLVQFPALMSE